jgi:hypothetical protein
LAPGWVRTDFPNLVNAIEAQRGKPGLQYIDYRGEIVAW